MTKPNETRKLLSPNNGRNASQIEFIMANAVRNGAVLLSEPGVPAKQRRDWALHTLQVAADRIAML